MKTDYEVWISKLMLRGQLQKLMYFLSVSIIDKHKVKNILQSILMQASKQVSH